MYLKLNGNTYEMENDKIEDLITENVITKTDVIFDGMGQMGGIAKSSVSSLLMMMGYSKDANGTALENALVDMVGSMMNENKDKTFEIVIEGDKIIGFKEVAEDVEAEG